MPRSTVSPPTVSILPCAPGAMPEMSLAEDADRILRDGRFGARFDTGAQSCSVDRIVAFGGRGIMEAPMADVPSTPIDTISVDGEIVDQRLESSLP